MSYASQRRAAYAVAIILAGVAVVQAADPADFGLTPIMVRWLGVLTAMLGVSAGFLPSIRGMSTDPGFLANRVSELPEHDRQQVVQDVQERAGEPPATLTPADLDALADVMEARARKRVQDEIARVKSERSQEASRG